MATVCTGNRDREADISEIDNGREQPSYDEKGKSETCRGDSFHDLVHYMFDEATPIDVDRNIVDDSLRISGDTRNPVILGSGQQDRHKIRADPSTESVTTGVDLPTTQLSVHESSKGSRAIKQDPGRPQETRRAYFAIQMYKMLEDSHRNGTIDIVSWNKDGTGFKVHDIPRFTKEIIPTYFRQTKYKSFLRQLTSYGFGRIAEGPYQRMRFHENFIRGNYKGVLQLKPVDRQTSTGSKKEASMIFSAGKKDTIPAAESSLLQPPDDSKLSSRSPSFSSNANDVHVSQVSLSSAPFPFKLSGGNDPKLAESDEMDEEISNFLSDANDGDGDSILDDADDVSIMTRVTTVTQISQVSQNSQPTEPTTKIPTPVCSTPNDRVPVPTKRPAVPLPPLPIVKGSGDNAPIHNYTVELLSPTLIGIHYLCLESIRWTVPMAPDHLDANDFQISPPVQLWMDRTKAAIQE